MIRMEKRLRLFLLSFILSLLVSPPPKAAAAQLDPNYYANICPNLENLVRGAVVKMMSQTPVAAPATLRLFFHDCFVMGCDASIMIISSDGSDEWRNPADFSLKAEGFETVLAAKAAVDGDLQCTNKVSCADILALATRDVVSLSGGPTWPVELGRYDGKVSLGSDVVLPSPDFNLDQLNGMFGSFGLTQTDMIALSGGHTIGASSCMFFYNRLYPGDPTVSPGFLLQLQQSCPNPLLDPNAFAFLDAATPLQFDNAYFRNLQQGMGLLNSDQVLFNDPRSQGTVNLFASNQSAFFSAFVDAMTRLGRLGTKTAVDGEIRRDCRFVN
ncbi:peroxidase 16-like [Ananas comosus]|uniref:Peroxidase n=1 Tax=Ananas comosus TaxID=4615 RepID=A0A6P5EGL3_ANACO|nr:peroxidase 16-like [Ananas comosus]